MAYTVAVELEIEAILCDLTNTDIDRAVNWLMNNNKIKPSTVRATTLLEEKFFEDLDLLRKSYYNLSKDQIDTIQNMATSVS